MSCINVICGRIVFFSKANTVSDDDLYKEDKGKAFNVRGDEKRREP